jgi:uncharacterized membrane-anchored protein
MRKRFFQPMWICATLFAALFVISGCSLTKETNQGWEVLNPEGVIKIEPMRINPHPPTLEGKTVMLRWNGKHNGDRFLNRIAELLAENVKNVKIIKSWEVAPETVDPITGSYDRSEAFARKIAQFKPDIVIGAQSD